MADETSVTSSESWGGRIKKSLGSAVFGLVLFLGSFGLLWWNEGRAVKTASSLGAAGKQVIDLASPAFSPAAEGKLIHLSGPATALTPAADPVFGLRPDALRIDRKVEMFQWVEKKESKTREKVGGGTETVTTYSYDKSWKQGRIDSSKFNVPAGHENPNSAWSDEHFTARPVKVGDYILDDSFLSRIGPSQILPLNPSMLATLPADLKRAETRVVENRLVTGDPDAARLGDLRLTWEYVPNKALVSLLGGQTGSAIGAFAINGVDVSRLENGVVPSATMIANAKSENKSLSWILRLVGFLAMWIGIRLVLAPLAMLLAFLPFLKKLVEFGIGIITFLIALAFTLATIAIAWIFFRPVLAVVLLLLAGGAIAGVVYYRKTKKAPQTA